MYSWQKHLFDILYTNRYLYRFASTLPFAGHWRTWQRLVLPHLHGRSVLEVGCGLGDLLVDMVEAGYECYAIEQSPEMVNAARSALGKLERGDPNRVVQGQAQQLPFPNASFDTVVSTFPNEYIYDPKTISEVERVLQPGGCLIIIVAAHLLPVDPIQGFLLLIQIFVYGSGILFKSLEELDWWSSNNQTSTSIVTETISGAGFAKQIPLDQYGFRRQAKCISSPKWKAYILIGEKIKS